MNERLTARQLAEWEAYNTLDPIGEDREDLRMGILASTIANMIGGAVAGKKAKTFKPEDFIPDWDGKKATTQTSEQMRNLLMGMASNKKGNKKNKK